MTTDPDDRGAASMLDRALEPYEPPKDPALFGLTEGAELPTELEELLELCRRLEAPDTLLEVMAEALAASYASTTFATAGNLLAELERRGVLLARLELDRTSLLRLEEGP